MIMTSPVGLWRICGALSFVCLEWAFIVMGSLWLSMAAKIRNGRLAKFADSCWRPVISSLLALLPLLTAVSFLSVAGDFSAQMLNAAANLLPVGLLAISLLVLAAAIMYDSIHTPWGTDLTPISSPYGLRRDISYHHQLCLASSLPPEHTIMSLCKLADQSLDYLKCGSFVYVGDD
jgi:hypothetical protein